MQRQHGAGQVSFGQFSASTLRRRRTTSAPKARASFHRPLIAMTTLPQTIDSRQPDSSRSGTGSNGYPPGYAGGYSAAPVSTLPAISAPMQLGHPGASSAGVQLSGADIMRVLRENLWLILLSLIVSAAAGYALNEYLKRDYLAYTSEGLLVVQTPEDFDPTNEFITRTPLTDEQQLDVRLQTQVANLKSDALFQAILQDAGSPLHSSTWLKEEAGNPDGTLNEDRVKELLLEKYKVIPREGSQLIRVSLSASDPVESKNILQYLVQTRIDAITDLAKEKANAEIRNINAVVQRRTDEIKEIDRRIREGESVYFGDNAQLAGVSASLTSDISRHGEQLIFAQRELRNAEQMKSSLEEAYQSGVDSPMLSATLDNNREVVMQRGMLRELDMALAIQEGQLGPKHPSIPTIRNRRDIAADQLRNLEDDIKANARTQILAQLDTQISTLRQTISELNITIADLSTKHRMMISENKEIEILLRQKETLEADLLTTRNMLDTRKAGLNADRTNEQQDLIWGDRPAMPTGPSFPQLPLTMAASLIVGVGLAMGIAFLREILDTSVKSPRDVVRAGQMEVLGVIPDEGDDPMAAVGKNPLELTIANAPHSMTAEQFRTVRSRLAHVAPLESTRSILITSPQPGDGKTTVACNLAAGMALNGRRVLLVDANFRKPRIHEVFGASNDVGLAGCLADADRFDDAIIEAKSVPNLYVLPAGPRPANATELIEGSNFTDVLDRALEQFDLVIFDSGPVLFVSETGALAPQVDGVISVVRARRSSRGLLGRLRDSLRSLNVEHLGVVLNAVQSRAGGYYNRNMKTYYAYQSKNRF